MDAGLLVFRILSAGNIEAKANHLADSLGHRRTKTSDIILSNYISKEIIS